jgi:archaellum component FlaC|uniref:Minor tail protein n=2 Tax=unclassified Caudoviricetes TaxID=2788787 RepID=A0A8S5VBT7_9CAUD|nr:MAG TPA: minor tail protein [Siphoviridae sp. ctHDv29]DAG04234.1 MAG TPA: minor tail protein [Siphoviridae sp. ctKsH2]
MADGKIVVQAEVDAKNAQKELDKLTAKIDKMEAELKKSTGEQSGLKSQLDAAKESAKQAENALKSLRTESERLRQITSGEVSASPEAYITAYGRQTEVAAQIKEQEAILKEQDKIVESLDGKYAKITDKVIEQTSALDAAKQKAGELTEQITNASGATERMEAAAKKVSDSMNTFSKRVSGLFKRVLVFSLITRALQSLRTWLGKTIMKNDEARAAVARLKAAFLTLAQPILQVVIPVFVKLVNILTQVVTVIAKFFGMLSGKSWSSQKSAAQGLNDEQKALEGVGAAAKDASKSMASFDEINQLTDNTASGAGGGGGAASTEIAPDFSNLDMAEDKLHDILGLVGAIAAGLLAWKIASLFTNDLSKIWGIALAVAGAFALVYFWLDAWNNGIDLHNFLGMLAGLAALAVGLAIAFGPIAAGIALVVGGLAMLVVGIKDVIENGFNLVNTLTIIAGLLAAGIGISLLTGSWIPLLIAGFLAALVALVSFTGHGEELIQGLKKIIDGFGKFFKGVFTGDMKLAVEGIKQIWEGMKQTWNAIVNSIKDAWNMFITWLQSKSPVLAAFFQTVGKLVSDLYNSVKDILKGIVDFVVGVFTGDWTKAWEGVKEIFKGIWNGIIATIEGAINFIIDGINLLISALNTIHFEIPDWVPIIGGKSFGISIPLVSQVALPRLAEGAVIPPNREFMAVLGDQKSGTNIETPLETMVQAFKQAMNESGGRSQTIILQLNGREFARAVYKANNEETQRVGVRLAGVKA